MQEKLQQLLTTNNYDPEQVLKVAAFYLDAAASSNKEQISTYHDNIVDWLKQYHEYPLYEIITALIEGVTNYYLTNYEAARTYLEKAKEIFKSGYPTDILGATYWALGALYRSFGNIDMAVEYQIKASNNIFTDGYFKITYAYANYQLGEIHLSIGEAANAKSYYEEANRIVSKTQDKTAAFRINNGLGNCHLHLKNYDESLSFLQKALDIKGISVAEKGRGLCDLGVLYLKKNDYKQAIQYLTRSLEIRRSAQLLDAASTSMIHLGDVYIRADNAEEAIPLLEEALSFTEQYNTLSKKIKACYLMAKAYEKIGDYKQALYFLNIYNKLNNEIRNEQEHKIFRYKNEQIEKQKKQIQQKNRQLKDTLDELAKVKTSQKALFFSIGTAIVLVILTEAFFDPLIDSYSYNVYISLGVKVLIALLLKPMDSFYERLLLRKALKLKE